jgi:putative membrane protein
VSGDAAGSYDCQPALASLSAAIETTGGRATAGKFFTDAGKRRSGTATDPPRECEQVEEGNVLNRSMPDHEEIPQWTSRRERCSRVRATRADAVLAGLLASWVKALSEPRLQTVAEWVLPPSDVQKLDVGADPSGHPQNMPPAVIIGRAASALGHARLTDRQRVHAQRIIHYTFGAGLGVAYSGITRRWPAATRGAGTLAGLAIYAGTHGSLLPALGIQHPPWRLAPAAVAWEATSHVLFGAALETARRLLEASR